MVTSGLYIGNNTNRKHKVRACVRAFLGGGATITQNYKWIT